MSFANKGLLIEPRISVDDSFQPKKILDAEIADYVLKALRDTVLIGTASDLSKNSVEIAGKNRNNK